MKAILKYDVYNEKKATFATYAFYWVRAEIIQETHRMGRILTAPYEKREHVKAQFRYLDSYSDGVKEKIIMSSNPRAMMSREHQRLNFWMTMEKLIDPRVQKFEILLHHYGLYGY